MARNKTSFETGRKKTGGRKKGTPNKRTTDIQELLNDVNPVARLEEILNSTDEESLKVKICLDLLPYMYPKRKAIELETKENTAKQEIEVLAESECDDLDYVLSKLKSASRNRRVISFFTIEDEEKMKAELDKLADYS